MAVDLLTMEAVLRLCCTDSDFRKEFIANPRALLDALGIEFAPGHVILPVEVPAGTVVVGLYPLIDDPAVLGL